MKKPSNENFIWLDFIRGVAALIVVFGHLRALTFEPYNEENKSSIIEKAFYFFSSDFGSMAVLIFFVLSGFFIVRSIDNVYNIGKWSFKNYLIARFSRLYTVLIPALLFTWIFDSLAYSISPGAPFYTGSIDHLSRNYPLSRLDWGHFFGSLLFLQRIVIEPFGSNGPLWSLSYEFWYYILFPLAYLAFQLNWSNRNKHLYASLFLVISIFLWIYNENIIIYFTLWLMGGFSYMIYKRQYQAKRRTLLTGLVILLLITIMVIGRLHLIPMILSNFLLGLVAAWTIYLLTFSKSKSFVKMSTFLSNISYTLYLTHFPLLAFFTSICGFYNQRFGLSSVILFFLFFSLSIFFSYCFWWLFERNTKIVKNFIYRLLNRPIPGLLIKKANFKP